MRIIQLTDLHLFADPKQKLKNTATRDTFFNVLAAARRDNSNFDYVIVTGDLAHDEKTETYLSLRGMILDWLPQCRVLPGNHDDRTALRKVFPEMFADEPKSTDQQEPITFSITDQGWRLIGLDSQLTGAVEGLVEDGQIEWLKHELSQEPNSPTILFLHHPPVPVNSLWLDAIGLQNPEPLVNLIESSPQVRLVCTGHVHQEFESRIGSARVVTTPSTGVQFLPGSDELIYDTIPPGYRVIECSNSDVETFVVRLPAQ